MFYTLPPEEKKFAQIFFSMNAFLWLAAVLGLVLQLLGVHFNIPSLTSFGNIFALVCLIFAGAFNLALLIIVILYAIRQFCCQARPSSASPHPAPGPPSDLLTISIAQK